MKRLGWVDALRGIAIIGVVIGHSMDIYPEFKVELIWRHMAYTIPWFVFLSSFTNTMSLLKHNIFDVRTSLRFYIKRFNTIILYCIATIIVYTLLNYPLIKISDLLNQLLNFSAQPTYYFINLLMLLYIVIPLLLVIDALLNKKGAKLFFIILLFFLSFYIFSPDFTILHIRGFSSLSLPWPFLPGGLFSGSGFYLFIFYCGIQYEKYQDKMKSISIWVILALFGVLETLLLFNKNLFHTGPYRNYFYLAWSILLLFILQRLVIFLYQKKISLTLLENIGQNSLYIYLFHYAILLLSRRWIVLSVYYYFYVLIASMIIPLIIFNAVPILKQNWGKLLIDIFPKKKKDKKEKRRLSLTKNPGGFLV